MVVKAEDRRDAEAVELGCERYWKRVRIMPYKTRIRSVITVNTKKHTMYIALLCLGAISGVSLATGYMTR